MSESEEINLELFLDTMKYFRMSLLHLNDHSKIIASQDAIRIREQKTPKSPLKRYEYNSALWMHTIRNSR